MGNGNITASGAGSTKYAMLVEQAGQIAGFNLAVFERDCQVARLNHAMAEMVSLKLCN